MVTGPSIIKHVNKMYNDIIREIKVTGGTVIVPKEQVSRVKGVLCEQIHGILTMEHLYCIEVFREALLEDEPRRKRMIESVERQIGEQYGARYFTLQNECEKIKKPPHRHSRTPKA